MGHLGTIQHTLDFCSDWPGRNWIQRVAKSLLSQYTVSRMVPAAYMSTQWKDVLTNRFLVLLWLHNICLMGHISQRAGKKRQALFAIKVELGDPVIPFKGARIPWVFFGSCYRNILTCFSKVTLKCMVFALELRVLNVRLGPYSAICTVRKHSFGRQSQSSLPWGS